MSLTSRIGPWFQQQWARLMETTTPTAVTGIGQIYTKADGYLYFQDGAGAEHVIWPTDTLTQYYGEGYEDNRRVSMTVREFSKWHGLWTIGEEGVLSGWTWKDGEENTITAFADAGDGEVTVTAAGHGLAAGDIVSINDTTNYDGVFVVESVSGNDFNITAAWAGDDAQGFVQLPGQLTCGAGSDGDYRVDFRGSINETGDDEFLLEVFLNTTAQANMMGSFRDGDNDNVVGISLSGLLEGVTEGDIISVMWKTQLSTGTALSVPSCNLNVIQIGK